MNNVMNVMILIIINNVLMKLLLIMKISIIINDINDD